MVSEVSSEDAAFLSTLAPSSREKKVAFAFIVVSVLFCLLTAPYAKLPLAKVWAFIPIYEASLIINDLITAVLLFGQFRILGCRSLCVLACGYLFTASTAAMHALTFPGLFSDTGLLGAGPQTTAWLYMFWHGGFPLFVIAYAWLKSTGKEWRASDRLPFNALANVALTLTAVLLFVLLATSGQARLPVIMQGAHYTPVMLFVVGAAWALSLLALLALFRRRPHSVLDLWLGVVMCAWLFDIALSAVLNAGRFDLGFYAGRIYGLLASSGVLVVLLVENGRLYAQLAESHRREHRKSIELAAVNEELEAFSYSVSHDLRAPLRAIDGFSKALFNRLDAQANGNERHYLERIRAAAQQMGSLIDDLISLSRVTRVPLQIQVVDVTQMCTEIFARLRDAEPGRNIQTMVADGLCAHADPRLLRVMLQNLLSNAWKYTSRQNPAMIEVGARQDGNSLVFYVKDNGAGFDMARAQGLFTPFCRLHSEEEFAGTGIGLATVYRIVNRHGGSIRAEAEPERGATFHFALEKAW